MQKSKLIGLVAGITGMLLTAGVVHAAPVVYIQTLPDYINYTDFKLSCTSNGNTAQFYSKKDGGSYTAFGPSINLNSTPCSVQVNGNEFGSEGKFWFEVIVDGVSSETSTTLDTTAPNAAYDFSKERINGGTTYRIHWKNPIDDFAKVYIYRGTEPGFNADDSHKITEAAGNPDEAQTWDDNGLDATKEYYYMIRTLDKAGNSSGLIGDAGVTTQVLGTATTAPAAKNTGTVVALPKEASVLGTEVSATPEASALPQVPVTSVDTNPGIIKNILTHKRIAAEIAVIFLLAAWQLYVDSKKNKKKK